MGVFGGAMLVLVSVVLAMLAKPALGLYIVYEKSLAVSTPDTLKGTYQSAIGNFGLPQYGGMLPGFVMYPAVNAKACDRFSTVSFRSHRPNFALVERGDCYFPTKVWNAQQAGAAAVLVMDNKKEDLIMMDSPGDDPWPSQYMQNVSIPSALISKEFGDKLKAALEAKELVTMKLDLRFIRLRLRRQPGLRLRGHQQQHEGQQVRPRMRRRSHPLSPNPSPPLLISPSSTKSTFVRKLAMFIHEQRSLFANLTRFIH